MGPSSLVVGLYGQGVCRSPCRSCLANDQGRTTNDAVPIPCSSPYPDLQLLMCKSTVTLSLHSLPQGRYHHVVPTAMLPGWPSAPTKLQAPKTDKRDHFASEFQPDWVSPQVSCGCARPGTTQRVLEKDNDNDTEIIPSDRPNIDCKRRETHDGRTRTSLRRWREK